jgi:hypothetical protein
VLFFYYVPDTTRDCRFRNVLVFYLIGNFKCFTGTKETSLIALSGHQKTRRKLITIIPKTTKILLNPKPKIDLKKRGESNRHQENLELILLNSNATPIKRKRAGYVCCFCDSEYPEAKDLKSHTLTAHNDECKSTFMKTQTMNTFIVKLDITSLHCSICMATFDVLEELTQHLTMNHGKRFHTGMKNYIVPFKFDTEDLRCALCGNKFNYFKILLEHMNSHYKNHVCDVCGEGFVNKRILLYHSYRHKKGVFNCTHCSKIFDTRVKQKEHERAVHVCLNKRNKCSFCGEKFTDYTKKNQHEVKMHGVRAIVLKCTACSRTFDNQRALTVHTKSYHLLEGRVKK